MIELKLKKKKLVIKMDEVEEIKKMLLEKRKPEKINFMKNSFATPFEVIGVMSPDLREIAKNYKNLDLYEMYNLFDELTNSKIHEEKTLAIYILQQYKKKFNYETWKFLKERISRFKTWDHIDLLATNIFSEILMNDFSLAKEVKEMAESKNPWERRLAIESTYKLIKKNKIEFTLRLAEKLIYDENVYVQKAAGWMLREVGKRNRIEARDFILMHLDMKANAFSYATEKMNELRKIKKEKIKSEKNGH